MSSHQAFEKFPRLDIQNLILREIRLFDSQSLFEILSNPAVVVLYNDDRFVEISHASDPVHSWVRGYQNRATVS
jgi:hypothetical protein